MKLLGYSESVVMRKRWRRDQGKAVASSLLREVTRFGRSRSFFLWSLSFSTLVLQIHEVGKKTENEHLMCWVYPPLLSLLAWIKFVCYEQRFFLYTVLWKNHSGFDIQTKKTILLSVKHSVDQCLKKFLGGTSVFSNSSKLFIKKYFCGLISSEIAK